MSFQPGDRVMIVDSKCHLYPDLGRREVLIVEKLAEGTFNVLENPMRQPSDPWEVSDTLIVDLVSEQTGATLRAPTAWIKAVSLSTAKAATEFEGADGPHDAALSVECPVCFADPGIGCRTWFRDAEGIVRHVARMTMGDHDAHYHAERRPKVTEAKPVFPDAVHEPEGLEKFLPEGVTPESLDRAHAARRSVLSAARSWAVADAAADTCSIELEAADRAVKASGKPAPDELAEAQLGATHALRLACVQEERALDALRDAARKLLEIVGAA